MPTIAYNALADHLSRIATADWPAVTLICGEEMLCNKACEAILDALLPAAEHTMGIERFDGGEDSLGAVLTCMNTYALLSGNKVVVLRDARLFYSAKARQGLREKMTQAARSGEMKKASRPFLNLMALCGLDFEALSVPAQRRKVVDDIDGQPAPWFSQLVDYCRDNGLRVPEKRDDADLFKAAMDKGFPVGHRLVITTDFADRRKALFKAIAESGLVVDCMVPKGDTRADRLAQDAVMQATIGEILTQAGKQMAVDARRRLVEWTGFDLRTLCGNLEKLVNFVGDRHTIEEADVSTVLQRSRKDPIFAFTNAVAEQDLPNALFYMNNLLNDDMHPLQLLSAAANQIRRLLLAKDFIVRDRGQTWSAGTTFPRFKAAGLKAVQTYDKDFTAVAEEWTALLNPSAAGKKPPAAEAADLVLARNPKSPFPVFQLLKKADNISLEALSAAIIDLSATDVRMKSTGQDPRLLLEAFLIRFCRRSEV